MADEIDQANEQAERWLHQALASRTTAPKLVPKGKCFYCDAEFDKNDPDFSKKLFCDIDCSSDYTEEQRLKNRR